MRWVELTGNEAGPGMLEKTSDFTFLAEPSNPVLLSQLSELSGKSFSAQRSRERSSVTGGIFYRSTASCKEENRDVNDLYNGQSP